LAADVDDQLSVLLRDLDTAGFAIGGIDADSAQIHG
jgi:hypothetical protein